MTERRVLTPSQPPNDPRIETMLELLDPLAPEDRKRRIIQARTDGAISVQEASLLIGAYGLEEL